MTWVGHYLKYGTISVVIPIWKPHTEQLKQCLDSMVKQTYDDLEFVLIYRKSTEFDNMFYSLINNYHDDKRLKVIESKTVGFTNSLNEGIEKSEGEFIARIDSDDFCETNRFERQLEFKKENHSNVVGTWAYSISYEGQKIGKIELPVTHEQIRRKMMLHCPMLHPSILMEKKIFSDIGLYDPSFIHAEDYELYFRAMRHGYRFSNVPNYLTYIREGTTSRSRGSEWQLQRRYYIKAKNKAFLRYGFNRYYDIFYHILTPLSYFVSPRIAYNVKRLSGWYKSD